MFAWIHSKFSRLMFAPLWDNLVATAPGTQMCDDSETVINMSLEKEGDETGLAPTLNKGRIASSIISALSKAIHFARILAMPERAGVAFDVRPRISLERWTIHDRILNERGSSAMVKLAVFFPLLSVLLFHQSICSTQTIAKDTFNGHMHLTKGGFIALGLDTTRIDENEKLFEDDFLPAMIHELKENFVKQIDKIELELERKLGDLRTGVTQQTVCLLFLLWFTHVTSMEGLVSEMKALRTDIAMQTESSKVHDEKAEEQALALPFADRDPLRLELCEPQDILVQLQDDQQLEQAFLKIPEPDTKDLETSEGQAPTIPSSVQDALLSKSSDAQEVVNRLQEEMQKEQSSLKQPDPETKKTIRCLARKAKCLSRLDVVKRLRAVTPAGTTGPLLLENLDVLDIPHEQIRELSVNLCGGDEWIIVAERLGLTPAEIRLLEKRCFKPFKKALKYSRRRQNWNVGQLYDVLVDCGFPIFAELL